MKPRNSKLLFTGTIIASLVFGALFILYISYDSPGEKIVSVFEDSELTVSQTLTLANFDAPNPSTWELEWYYFGDLACSFTAGHDEFIRELIATAEKGDEEIEYILTDIGEPNREPKLIERFRDIVEHKPNFPWHRAWPLKVLIRRMPDFSNEFIITPDALILAWPFPIENPALKREFDQKVRSQIPPFPMLNEQGVEYRSDRDVLANSVLWVIDKLIFDPTAPERERLLSERMAERRQAIIDYAERLRREGRYSGSQFILPSNLKISADPEMPSVATKLIAESEDTLHLQIGLVRVNREGSQFVKRAALSTEAARLRFDDWPCGGFN